MVFGPALGCLHGDYERDELVFCGYSFQPQISSRGRPLLEQFHMLYRVCDHRAAVAEAALQPERAVKGAGRIGEDAGGAETFDGRVAKTSRPIAGRVRV